MLRRKKQGKTNYKKRLALLKSGKIRLVIRITNKNIITQAIDYDVKGDKVLGSVNSRELAKYGWNISRKNLSAAYLTGYLLGKKTGKKEMIPDFGLQNPKNNSVLYSTLKGIIDSGVNIKVPEKAFPKEERLTGKHIKQEKLFETVKKTIENGRK